MRRRCCEASQGNRARPGDTLAHFQRRHGLEDESSLEAITAAIREFALPVFAAALARRRLEEWPPGGPWRHENMNE